MRCYSDKVFGKEEAAKENYFVYKREKELIKKLRDDLHKKETEALTFLKKNPTADPDFHKELESKKKAQAEFKVSLNAHFQGKSDAFSKRGSASEDKYIHDLEKEHAHHKK